MKFQTTTYKPYLPRPVAFLGVEECSGYALKLYSIRVGDQPFDRTRFSEAWGLLESFLPTPAISIGRPGVGFGILHQGATGDYFVAGWWDRENELPTRVLINDGSGWRRAEGSESFCVWDLRLMWWEREAYIATVLSSREAGVEAYLSMTMEGYA